jgi:hypothetical protein
VVKGERGNRGPEGRHKEHSGLSVFADGFVYNMPFDPWN